MAVLRASKREVQSQTMGDRSVRRTACLSWDALIELYGDEATLRERIDQLKTAHPADAGDLLELADKHLAGWRPGPVIYKANRGEGPL